MKKLTHKRASSLVNPVYVCVFEFLVEMADLTSRPDTINSYTQREKYLHKLNEIVLKSWFDTIKI